MPIVKLTILVIALPVILVMAVNVSFQIFTKDGHILLNKSVECNELDNDFSIDVMDDGRIFISVDILWDSCGTTKKTRLILFQIP